MDQLLLKWEFKLSEVSGVNHIRISTIISEFCAHASLQSLDQFIKKSLSAFEQSGWGDLRSTVSLPAFYKYRVPAPDFQEYNICLEWGTAKASACRSLWESFLVNQSWTASSRMQVSRLSWNKGFLFCLSWARGCHTRINKSLGDAGLE